MKNRFYAYTAAALVGALAIAAASISPAQAQIPRGTCMVSDPTGTPLNVRRYPNGPIIGNLRNGSVITIHGIRRDNRGRPWARIFSTDGTEIGWIFREYISCRQ